MHSAGMCSRACLPIINPPPDPHKEKAHVPHLVEREISDVEQIPSLWIPPPHSCTMNAANNQKRIEGRGNGIKTNIVNNVDIAKSLERPPECEFVSTHGSRRIEDGVNRVVDVCAMHWRVVLPQCEDARPSWRNFHNFPGCFGTIDSLPLLQSVDAKQSSRGSLVSDVLKYFGYELGAQTNYDKATGTCIVNGAHDSKKNDTKEASIAPCMHLFSSK
eukprot:699182-Pelagomonas_calceolata.AAC.1